MVNLAKNILWENVRSRKLVTIEEHVILSSVMKSHVVLLHSAWGCDVFPHSVYLLPISCTEALSEIRQCHCDVSPLAPAILMLLNNGPKEQEQ